MKLLITAITITITLNAYSQSNVTVSNDHKNLANTLDASEIPEETDESIIKTDPTLPNGIMLYGTKMVIVNNGVVREMQKEIVLPNGTRVRPDGHVYRKNRPKILLNFGEYVDTSGKILPMENINSFTN